jgi:hypothetical protein
MEYLVSSPVIEAIREEDIVKSESINKKAEYAKTPDLVVEMETYTQPSETPVENKDENPIDMEFTEEAIEKEVSNVRTQSIISQCSDLIQNEINDLELPVTINEVDVISEDNGVLTGKVELEGQEVKGSFMFTASVSDDLVEDAKCNFDLLLGKFGYKKYLADLDIGKFEVVDTDENKASLKVLSHVINKTDGDISLEGRVITAGNIKEAARRFTSQLQVIKVYNYPDSETVNASTENNDSPWKKVIDASGAEYLIRNN